MSFVLHFTGQCPNITCSDDYDPLFQAQTAGKEIEGSSDEGVVPASTSVFVLEPGETPSKLFYIFIADSRLEII